MESSSNFRPICKFSPTNFPLFGEKWGKVTTFWASLRSTAVSQNLFGKLHNCLLWSCRAHQKQQLGWHFNLNFPPGGASNLFKPFLAPSMGHFETIFSAKVLLWQALQLSRRQFGPIGPHRGDRGAEGLWGKILYDDRILLSEAIANTFCSVVK